MGQLVQPPPLRAKLVVVALEHQLAELAGVRRASPLGVEQRERESLAVHNVLRPDGMEIINIFKSSRYDVEKLTGR
jgi:hypothetical protein